MGQLTFLYTNSFDTTCDLLISRLGSEHVFRLNFDLWRDYRVEVHNDGFRIENPAGRVLERADVAKVYWRKPMRQQHMSPDARVPQEESYLEEELWYALREVINLLWCDGKVILTEPFGDTRAGKFLQAAAARRYLKVPPFRFVCGEAVAVPSAEPVVVKSLTSTRAGPGAILYTTKVAGDTLAPATPWMTQMLVEAEKDVTVVYVRDKLFAFELERGWFRDRTCDWREVSLETGAHNDWQPHALPATVERAIHALMADLGLQYGRLDLLLAGAEYWFLEVNSNGEWGWLDPDGKHGLLDKMLEELSPLTPAHPLPVTRPLRV